MAGIRGQLDRLKPTTLGRMGRLMVDVRGRLAPGLKLVSLVDGQAAIGSIPLRRLAEPEEIAYAAVFLAGPAADFINGHVLSVDGGGDAAL